MTKAQTFREIGECAHLAVNNGNKVYLYVLCIWLISNLRACERIRSSFEETRVVCQERENSRSLDMADSCM